jgi:hypothetical protein
LELEEQRNDLLSSLREAKGDISELKAQKENLKKQSSNFNMVNIRKNLDMGEFEEEQETLEISNRY